MANRYSESVRLVARGPAAVLAAFQKWRQIAHVLRAGESGACGRQKMIVRIFIESAGARENWDGIECLQLDQRGRGEYLAWFGRLKSQFSQRNVTDCPSDPSFSRRWLFP